MYTTLKFPTRDLLHDFEDALDAKGLGGNASSNYVQFTFEKKDITEEILAIAKEYKGEKIS